MAGQSISAARQLAVASHVALVAAALVEAVDDEALDVNTIAEVVALLVRLQSFRLNDVACSVSAAVLTVTGIN